MQQSSCWFKLLKWTGAALAVLALGVFVGFRIFERHALYHPKKEIQHTPAEYGLQWEERTIPSFDGTKLVVWHIKADKPGAPLLLYMHGNSGNIGDFVEEVKLLRGLGYEVVMPDYRGYGRSEGKPYERGIYGDVQAVYDWAQAELKPRATVIFGRSLGTGISTYLASTRPCSALVLESPFTSITNVAQERYFFIPVRLVGSQRFDSLSRITSINCPLLILHSVEDEVVPYHMGRELFAAAREPKEFFDLHGTHHAGWKNAGPAFVEHVGAFLSKYVK